MAGRPVRRALILAVVGALLVAGVASADNLRGDGDAVEPGSQTFVDLGEVAPSAVLAIPVSFELVCTGVTHLDPGQSVTLALGAQSAPSGGAVVSVTGATLGPVPTGWPSDGADCADPPQTLTGATTATVTLRAPATPRPGYVYTIGWRRTVGPAGIDDAHALSGSFTAVSFSLDVVTNAAPQLTVPGDQVVEGDTTGGWVATYPGVIATDAEDDPDPTPICSPAAGEVLPLGTTTVACTVTDSGGRTASDAFDVTVVDTTAPTLTVPGDQSVVTDDPTGTTLSYEPATAVDIVDAAPVVACVPTSGSAIPVGTTTVTCTATDATGNVASAGFDVAVTYVPRHTASATWLEPVGTGTDVFVANRGRTLPVKVVLSVDGAVRQAGDAALRLAPCSGGAATVLPMSFGGGRWNAQIDTSVLAGACYAVGASIDGLTAGSFTLELRGAEAASVNAKPGKGH